MTDLIKRLRGLVNDPAGASQVFDSQTLQDTLDRRRTDVRYLQLVYGETIGAGGAVTYLVYYAPHGLTDWESDGVLQYGGTWATLIPATSDWQAGRWTFSTSQLPPVYLTGVSYDLYAAAADVLERRAAQLAEEFDLTVDDQQLRRGQQAPALLTLVKQYRGQQRPAVVAQGRGDLWS